MKVKLQQLQEMVSRLSPREKIVFYGAAFFVSLTLIDRMIISPISGKLKTLDDEIRQKRQEISRAVAIVSQKEKISRANDSLNAYKTDSRPGEEEMTSLLKEIESMANKSSVYLIDLKPAGAKGSGLVKRYLISLNCEAQMEQLVDFMYNVESSNRLLTIEKYQVSPKSKESSIARCSMSLSKLFLQ